MGYLHDTSEIISEYFLTLPKMQYERTPSIRGKLGGGCRWRMLVTSRPIAMDRKSQSNQDCRWACPQKSTTTSLLAAGDTLTFLSDGVVEAQNASGELFGFERAQAIGTESAEPIAQAAHALGQRDDITVLTLQYTSAEVLLA